MKLSDIHLNDLRARALLRWLDSMVTPEERAAFQEAWETAYVSVIEAMKDRKN